METLAGRLEQQFPLLANLRIAEGSSENHESLPFFLGLLLAASQNEDRKAVCFVFPDTSKVTDTVATLISLSWLSSEFEKLARGYALSRLQPGQRVLLWPTKHVYQYAGIVEADEHFPEGMRLKIQGKQEFRTLRISDALRLEPTNRKTPKGTQTIPRSSAVAEPNALDMLLDIRSHGNTSMLRNRVLYLTSKSGFEEFLSSTKCLRRNGTAGTAVTLAETLPWGTVKEDGSFSSSDSYRVEGEPLLAISHSVENIAEASLTGDPFSRVVLCKNLRSLTRNLQACDEITESQKLVVVASHSDSETIRILADRDFGIWYISPEEMHLDSDTSDGGKSSYFGKPLAAVKNYRDLELTDVVCRDKFVESAAENLLRASNELKHPDSDEEAKRCLGGLFKVLFSISDRCVPLDADDIVELHDCLSETRSSISKRKLFISDAVEEYVSEFCIAISRLITSNMPGSRVGEKKGEVLLKLLQKDDGYQKSVIVTRHSENVGPVQNWLQLKGVEIPVMWHRRLPEDETFDRIILTSWLNSDRFGTLVRKYTSPRISLLGYPFEKTWLEYYKTRLSRERSNNQTRNDKRSAISGIAEELFPTIATSLVKTSQTVEDNLGASSILEIEQRILRRRKGTRPSNHSGADNCESRYVGFIGEFYAHLTESREVPVVTSLIAGQEPSTGTVPERTVDELAIGDFILFREGSDKDVVQLFAEESIGQEEYERIRKLANVWREALLARGGSVRELHRLLKSYGLNKTESTIRNWLHNRRRIGPYMEQDVHTIARATNKTPLWKPDEVWEAISTIRNAHRSAGHQISAWLLEELSDGKSLVADGGGKVDLGFGELQIVEVEEISTELETHPMSRTNRLLRER